VKLTTLTPDVVISDSTLPGEDRIKFIQWLRSSAVEGGTVAIVVTFSYDRYDA
jgi:DNA-binding NarL/FixJ family response regulator